jgi:hypothetical protein
MLPEAKVKIFLSLRLWLRAQRRYLEILQAVINTWKKSLNNMRARDRLIRKGLWLRSKRTQIASLLIQRLDCWRKVTAKIVGLQGRIKWSILVGQSNFNLILKAKGYTVNRFGKFFLLKGRLLCQQSCQYVGSYFVGCALPRQVFFLSRKSFYKYNSSVRF